MQLLMILVLFASILALCFAAFNFFGVKKDAGDCVCHPDGSSCVHIV